MQSHVLYSHRSSFSTEVLRSSSLDTLVFQREQTRRNNVNTTHARKYQGVLDLEDTDRNRFVVDVIKTAFLKEGFGISRVGGSVSDGATSPTAAKERGDVSKRASSRPSSGKVRVIERKKKGAKSCLAFILIQVQHYPTNVGRYPFEQGTPP